MPILPSVASLTAIGIGFLGFYRPWHIRWGATDQELAASMPGDEIVPDPVFNATRAVTVEAPPSAIWVLQPSSDGAAGSPRADMSGAQLKQRIPAALAAGALVGAAVAILARASVARAVVFEDSVEVDCPAVKAFDLLVNTDRHATGPGSPVLRMERIPDAEAHVGTRWREVIRLGCLGRMTVWSQIVALDAPTHLGLRFRLPGAIGTVDYRIGPGQERETCISQEQTFVVAGMLGPLLRWMIERLWKPRATERLQEIRAILESDTRLGA